MNTKRFVATFTNGRSASPGQCTSRNTPPRRCCRYRNVIFDDNNIPCRNALKVPARHLLQLLVLDTIAGRAIPI